MTPRRESDILTASEDGHRASLPEELTKQMKHGGPLDTMNINPDYMRERADVVRDAEAVAMLEEYFDFETN